MTSKPSVFVRAVVRFYSAVFRYFGLALAILSFIAFAGLTANMLFKGYLLVDGQPTQSFGPIALTIGMPFVGVALGLALFYLLPKRSSGPTIKQ